jgi:hypothetical protein
LTDQIASQPGKLCLYVIRQDLPALPRGPGDAHADRAYTVESNDESGIDSTMPVWPKNCLYTGVIVRANIEMPTQAAGATGSTPAQLFDQPTQLFSDSMLAASQASSEVGAMNDISPKAAREQASASADESTSPAVPDPHGLQSSNSTAQTATSQQPLQTPEVQLINSAATPICPPIGSAIAPSGASMVVAGQAMSLDGAARSTVDESSSDQASVAQSSGVLSDHAQPGGDSPETPSKLAGARLQDKGVPVAHTSKTRKDLAHTATAAASNGFENLGLNAVPITVPNGVQNSLPDANLSVLSNSTSDAVQSAAAEAPSNTVSNAGQNAAPNAVLNAPPSTSLNATSNAAPNAVQSTNSNEAMNGMQDSSPGASLNGLSGAGPSDQSQSAPDSAIDGMQDSLPNAGFSGLSSAAPNFSSNKKPNAFEGTAQNAQHSWLRKSFLEAVLTAFAKAGPNAVSNAAPSSPARIVPNNGPDAVPSAVSNVVPNQVQNANPDAVASPTSGSRLSAEQLPVPQAVPAASAKEVFAVSSGSVAADLATPPATSPDQTLHAAAVSVTAATVDPIASPAQFSSRSFVEGQAGLSGGNPASIAKPSEIFATNSKDEIKGVSDDATSTKLHASPESNQSKLQRDNQETTPSGDQGQNSSASQGQNTVRPEMNFANHTVAVASAAQALVNTSQAQNSAIPAGATAHTAKTPEIATPAPAAAPQAMPVINTARLIQSMGQSEMRVGMRSTEFGNISISTSSTRDLISAQISLDHGELARTLTAHLPEMQARLGGNQPMDVRIEMNGTSAGQTGTTGGMYNGSADQSRGGRQQAGNADSSSSGNRFTGQQMSPVASAMATSDRGVNARLDIRV